MVFYVNTEHPKDVLLFYLAGTVDKAAVDRVAGLIDEWAAMSGWVVGPPTFVHQTEEVADPRTGQAVVTLGGFLRMYTAHGAWRDRIPREVDEAHFRECEQIVRGLEMVSTKFGDEYHFEFDGELIGAIRDGKADDGLAQHFLGVWRRALGIERGETGRQSPE